MRKRIISPAKQQTVSAEQNWLNINELVEVELTSEDPLHPIENALLPGENSRWWAAEPGKQTIRLLFTQPQPLRRIYLSFVEEDNERTQEFALRWSPDNGQSFQEITRQQWNFSPRGATSETEDFHVDLAAVTVLELNIVPNISKINAFASLAQLKLA